MPLGDRTGPMGLGPMTGRGLGYCAGYPTPGYMNPYRAGFGWGRGLGYGRGFGFGRGFGYGRGFGFRGAYYPYPVYPFAQAPVYNELDFLKAQANVLKETLEEIQKRISSLEQSEKNG